MLLSENNIAIMALLTHWQIHSSIHDGGRGCGVGFLETILLFRLWEEVGVPGKNPSKRGKNMQTPHIRTVRQQKWIHKVKQNSLKSTKIFIF